MCAGRRDGREACAAVGTVMCRVLLVRGRCVMYAGGWRLCSMLETLEGMRRVLLCMLEAVEGELCLLEGLG